METPSIINAEKKIGDTANTVQVFDCITEGVVSNVESSHNAELPPALIRLIDILARQTAREICDTKEGEQA